MNPILHPIRWLRDRFTPITPDLVVAEGDLVQPYVPPRVYPTMCYAIAPTLRGRMDRMMRFFDADLVALKDYALVLHATRILDHTHHAIALGSPTMILRDSGTLKAVIVVPRWQTTEAMSVTGCTLVNERFEAVGGGPEGVMKWPQRQFLNPSETLIPTLTFSATEYDR